MKTTLPASLKAVFNHVLDGEWVVFKRDDDAGPGLERVVTIRREEWQEMGEPESVTVAVIAGDWRKP